MGLLLPAWSHQPSMKFLQREICLFCLGKTMHSLPLMKYKKVIATVYTPNFLCKHSTN